MDATDSQMSDGSDLDVENEDSDDLDDGEMLGMAENESAFTRDPIDRAQLYTDPGLVLAMFADSDDEENDFEGFHDEWIKENFTQRTQREYTKEPGIAFLQPEDTQPVTYFEMLWNDAMWDRLLSETNSYAEQERAKNPPPPFAPKWQPLDKAMMKAFIGLCLCMGILKLPSMSDYWRQKRWLFRTSFNQVMSRDRFQLIWRYLHIQDNTQPNREDKLWKMRWFLDFLNARFHEAYTPQSRMTVDESMVKFKGRLSFRQYMPAKPIKWGVKVWTLAESDTGYMIKFQVYTGKEAGNQERGLSQRVVLDLVQPFHGSYPEIYMDNFYTSPDLLTTLLARGVYGCGTVRANRRGLPKEILQSRARLPKHQQRSAQKDHLSFSTWMDTKAVTVISNFHSAGEVGSVQRRVGGTRQQVPAPKCLVDYQKYMKGVDLCDQMVGYYQLNHRSRKWWRRIFFYLLQVCVHNAYIIAKDNNREYVVREWPHLQDFLEEIIESLISDTKSQRQAPIPMAPTQSLIVHNISVMFEKKKTCKECALKAEPGQRRGTTKFGCQQCNEPVHLACQAFHIARHNGQDL